MDDEVLFHWLGAAHYRISFRGLCIVIDPLYTRLAGDVPHLDESREDCPAMDCLLLTHAHLDHSLDFPYVLARHKPMAYAPAKYLRDLENGRIAADSGADASRCRALEHEAGKSFSVGDVEITPYRVGTEEIDFWFLRSMLVRPFAQKRVGTVPFGFRWLSHHLLGNCFAYLFRFPVGGNNGTTMLYFGNLTEDAYSLEATNRVDVLALPYCPANSKWRRQTAYLIRRFSPRVVLVHHYDNFMNPYTLSKYLELADYREAVSGDCPGAAFFYSKFCRDVALSQILAEAGEGEGRGQEEEML